MIAWYRRWVCKRKGHDNVRAAIMASGRTFLEREMFSDKKYVILECGEQIEFDAGSLVQTYCRRCTPRDAQATIVARWRAEGWKMAA